ncbi:MAG: TonB-dependent receptor [Bacteroidota bacterium]
MKNLLYFSILFLFCTQLSAQSVTLVDEATSHPLEFVSITSNTISGIVIRTSARGVADISPIRYADSIFFSLFGYEPMSILMSDLARMNYRVSLKSTGFLVNEVVVSSSRWDQRTDEIPQKITSITPHDVMVNNPQTAADLLALSRQVFVQKSQMGGGSPMIRGFATNRVLLVVDGVRMNNAIFRAGNLHNVISIDANAVDHAEVLFGPGSVVYGSDALGGVMSFQTLEPKISEQVSVATNALVRYSNANNERTGHIDFMFGQSNFSSATSVSYSKFGNLQIGSNGDPWHERKEYVTTFNGIDSVVQNPDRNEQVESRYNQYNMMQKFRFIPSPEWEIGYNFHYSATSDVPRYDRLTQYRNGVLRYAEWYYGPQRWMMNSLNVQFIRSTLVFDRIKLTAAHQEFQESRHDRVYRNQNLRHQYERVIAYSVNLDAEKIFDDAKELYYGSEIVANNISSTAQSESIKSKTLSPTISRYPDGSSWNSYAAYAMMNMSLSERSKISAGVRYNAVAIAASFDSSFLHFPFPAVDIAPGALTGSLGGVYKVSENWQTHLNVSTGFRAPNIDDLGKIFESTPGTLIVPNPELSAEYAYNADLRIIGVIDNKVKIDVTGFYTILNDAIVVRDFRLNGQDSIIFDGVMSRVRALQNTSDAYVYGINTSLHFNASEHFSLRTDVNWQHGRELDNAANRYVPMRHVAPLFGSIECTYQYGKFSVIGSLMYNGEITNADLSPSLEDLNTFPIDDSGKPYSPSWYTLNLKGMYQVSGTIQLTAGMENIFDTRYRTYSSGISAPGRNFIVGVNAGI